VGSFERTLKILPAGGVSLAVTVPVQVECLEDLVAVHEALIGGVAFYGSESGAVGDGGFEGAFDSTRGVSGMNRKLTRCSVSIRRSVWTRRIGSNSIDGRSRLCWCRKKVCRFACAHAEVEETVTRKLGYYRDDVMAWLDRDAALLLDREGPALEVLHVPELANLQLCELEVI